MSKNKFTKIYCSSKLLNHTFKKSVIISDIKDIDNETIIFLNKEDKDNLNSYMNLTKYASQIVYFTKNDIIDISFNSLNKTSLFKRNTILKDKSVKELTNNHIMDIKYDSAFLHNEKDKTYINKFHYATIKSIIKKLKHLGYSNKDNLNIEEYFQILKIITKNSYNRKRFNDELKVFKQSIFCKGLNNKVISLVSNKEIYKEHSLYTNIIIKKDATKAINKHNTSTFLNNCIAFSYGIPLSEDKKSNIKSVTSQETVAKYYGLTQPQISKATKSMAKLYKFERVTENEYNYWATKQLTQDDESNTYIFAIKTLKEHVDMNGEVKKLVFYFRTVGSRLISKFKYSSTINNNDKVLRLNKFVNSKKKSSLSLNGKESSTNYKDINLETIQHTDKLNITNNNDLVKFLSYYNQVQKHSDIKFAETNQSQTSTSLQYDKNLQIQFVGDSYKAVKSKLQLLMHQMCLVEVLMNNVNVKSFNISRSLTKQQKHINYAFYQLKQFNKDLANLNYMTYRIFMNVFKELTSFINSKGDRLTKLNKFSTCANALVSDATNVTPQLPLPFDIDDSSVADDIRLTNLISSCNSNKIVDRFFII